MIAKHIIIPTDASTQIGSGQYVLKKILKLIIFMKVLLISAYDLKRNWDLSGWIWQRKAKAWQDLNLTVEFTKR